MSAVGELVLRIEEEQQRQQVARQFGVSKVRLLLVSLVVSLVVCSSRQG
jgi:hypothetical protein